MRKRGKSVTLLIPYLTGYYSTPAHISPINGEKVEKNHDKLYTIILPMNISTFTQE